MTQQKGHIVSQQNSYRIELFQEKDIANFCKYIKEIFNKEYSAEYVRWKYFNNPTKTVLSQVLYKDDIFIGFKGCILQQYHIKGEIILGAGEEDNFLRPEHRSIHLYLWFSRIFKEYLFQNKVLFIVGFPNENAIEIVKLDPENFKVADRPFHVRYCNVAEIVTQKNYNPLFAGIMTFLFNFILKLKHLRFTRKPVDSKIEILDYCDERFDAFWENIKNDYPIIGVRNSAFLKWRYLDTPFVNGRIICLKDKKNSTILGYSVIGTTFKNNSKIGNIYEFMAPRNTAAALIKFLLQKTIDYLQKQDVHTIITWITKDMHTYKFFKDFDFSQRGKKWEGIYIHKTHYADKKLDTDFLKDSNNWYFSRNEMYFH